jgi:hypothetical protein
MQQLQPHESKQQQHKEQQCELTHAAMKKEAAAGAVMSPSLPKSKWQRPQPDAPPDDQGEQWQCGGMPFHSSTIAKDPDLAVQPTMLPTADNLPNGIKLCSPCSNHIYNFDLKKM